MHSKNLVSSAYLITDNVFDVLLNLIILIYNVAVTPIYYYYYYYNYYCYYCYYYNYYYIYIYYI